MTDTDLDDEGYGEESTPATAGLGDNKPPATFEDELRIDHQDVFLKLDALKLSRAKLPVKVDDDTGLEQVGAFILEARALVKAAERAHKAAKEPFKLKVETCDKLFLTKGIAGEVAKMTAVVQAIADDYTERKAAKRRVELAAAAERARTESEGASYEAQNLQAAGSHSVAEVVLSQGEHAEKTADRLAKKAAGGVSDLVRTHMDGMTASGRTVWTFEIEDSSKIDFNALSTAILDHELRQIIQRFVDKGERLLPGVRIYEKNVSTFR